ncbi:MAG: hypothetical protein KBG15_07510 [Kofleriaceae bacterium]|nr:hypothetical protein [Kofleriaceae bacterium]
MSAALAAMSASCGDNGVNCGEGTKAVDGSCVPDGTVVCTGGTRFNADNGTCEVDPAACQDGTVLVDNQCVDPGVVAADATEAAEPNDDVDPVAAGRITVPAIGAKGFVIKGCVTPHRDVEVDQNGAVVGDGVLDADLDPWIVTVAAPTLLDVKADGIRGLVAGFVMVTGDAELADAGFQRQGVSVVNDQAGREVFLPKAGTYVLFMADSRTLLKTDVGPGDANTCYYATVSQKAMPAPTAVTTAITAGNYDGKVDVYSYTNMEGDIIDATARPESLKTYSGLVVMKNGAYASSSVETDSAYAAVRAGGLKTTDDVKVVYDPDVVYSGRAVDYSYVSTSLRAKALPLAGTTVTYPNGDGTLDTANELGLAYFDIASDGDIAFLDLTSDEFVNYTILDSNLGAVATGTVAGLSSSSVPEFNDINLSTDADADWFRFAKAGRYYVAFYAPGVTGNYVVTAALTKATQTLFAYGTDYNNTALGNGAQNSAFGTLNVAANTKNWAAITASSATFAGNVNVRSYELTSSGRFDVDFGPTANLTLNKNGTDLRGNILGGAALNVVVRVSDTAANLTNTKLFNFKIADRVFTDLGTAVAGTPINLAALTVAANSSNRYFLKAAKGSLVTVLATPTNFNLAAVSLRANEAALTTADLQNTPTGAESLRISAADGWVAFEILNPGNATGTFNLAINTITPAAFTEICPSAGGAGTLLPQTVDGSGGPLGDEALTATQTAAFNFPLFGASVTNFKVSTNGFLSFDPTLPNNARFSNGILPTVGLNGFVAPYWDDLQDVEICRLNGTNKVTIEWKGAEYGGFFGPGAAVRFSATLYSTGQVDFAYAPTHAGTGAGATLGLTNLAGTAGNQVSRNVAGSTAPNTAIALQAD